MLQLCPDTLIIPNDSEMKDEADAWVNSHNTPGSGNNDANPLYGNQRIIVWPYLNQFIGTAKPWFIMDSKFNTEADGAVYQNRLDMVIRSVLGDNDENIWKGRARFAGGFVDWRCLMGGGMTGGGPSGGSNDGAQNSGGGTGNVSGGSGSWNRTYSGGNASGGGNEQNAKQQQQPRFSNIAKDAMLIKNMTPQEPGPHGSMHAPIRD